MGYAKYVLGLAAMSAAANAQTPTWQFFEGEGGAMQAFVQDAEGRQLILKCDKPGRGSVSAVVFVHDKLITPNQKDFDKRPIELMFDDDRPQEETWRFYENVAMAVNQPGERTLPRFVEQLSQSSQLRARLKPGDRAPTDVTFDVTGASEAITEVYKACKDQNPAD